ncbi:MAG: hypothetical protein MUC48_15490 [Leptolyngbya sp. Prado105]|jgi:hypothetical protein|nr:hypothetical protein [Leptolyngbya sp. Prado105]
MAFPESRRISVELDANHPNFLAGLELWLQLGLISDRQILTLSQKYLTDTLPIAPVPSPPDFVPPDFVSSVKSRIEPPALHRIPPRQSFLRQMIGSLQQELSVVWLLVLGVFLVIISSAVLAASQWQNVSPTGQYLVLLAYTLSFWGVSFWAGRQENLRLTASTLQTLTLLLVPVNFWAIDSFLLHSIQPLSLLTALVVSGILTAVSVLVFRQQFPNSAGVSPALVGYLGLSYLQCGWNFPNLPVSAVYLGAIAATIVRPTAAFTKLVFPTVAVVLLFLRAIFIAEVDIAQLGLAFGIVGWLVVRVAQHHSFASLWLFAAGLLGFGWFVSVHHVAWQALIISGLALGFWAKLLQRYWRRLDIIGLLLVGLQSIWLIWRLVPSPVQTQIVNAATNLTQTQTVPFALLGIALFPSVLGMITIAKWLERQEKPELAQFTAAIALLFGIGLTGISAFAPATRTLNLVASTLTLAGLTQQKQNPKPLVYATHLVGLAALAAAIQWRFPLLSQSAWAGIFLGIAIVQWGFTQFRDRWEIWRQSAWHIGFGIASLSYILFFEAPFRPAIAWALIPMLLSEIAVRDESRRIVASTASVFALAMLQIPAMQHWDTGLLSLGLAALLLFVNSRCLRRIELAYLTIGCGLGTVGWWIWHRLPGFTLESWLLVSAISLAVLWQFQRWARRHDSMFVNIYAQAADNWAAGLSGVTLLGAGVHTINVYHAEALPSMVVVGATALVTGSLLYRTWQTSSIAVFIGVGVGLELLIAESLAWLEPSLAGLSLANVGLGLLTQSFGDLWQRRKQIGQLSLGWHGLPLGYGILALVFRSNLFTAWTGWVTLGVAWIAISISRRQLEFKPLTYLGIIGLSIAAYELVLYQTRLLPMSDQLMGIATLGTILMLLYRSAQPVLLRYLRLTAEEIRPFAHGHWAVSSGVLSIAAILTLMAPDSSGVLALVGFTTGMVLSLYAIWQARHRPPAFAVEAWLYAGLLEAAGLAWYLSTKPWFSGFFSEVVRPYAVAISAIAAFILFVLPWDRLGWARQPWQRVAIAVPLLVLAGTATIVHPFSLIVVAIFYSLVASIRRQVRWTYLSVAALNWLVLDQLQIDADVLFWQVLPIGLSILYFAQVEPSFVQSSERTSRHYVRICGMGLICGTALLTQANYGILPGIVSLMAIFAGLGLRIRAFLYIGTLTFLLNIINQLIVFVAVYSLLKWIIGLCLGILLIWVAANFETRRGQMTALMQNWLAELQEWQ